MHRFFRILAVQLTGIALFYSLSLASVPTTMSYQGTLNDKGGSPVTASMTLVFSLYNVANGADSALWTETQSLTVTAGRFGAVLGLVTPLDVSLFSGNTWLGIAVQGEPEMTPRQKLTSVAYAFKAQEAESVSNTDSIIPPGSVMTFAGTSLPLGWLWCDGTEYDKTTYPRLSTAIGTAHGTSNAATKFRVPDYRGRFLRGLDGAAGRDPDKSSRNAMNSGGLTANNIGTVQWDSIQGHKHIDSGHNHGASRDQGLHGLPGDYGNYSAQNVSDIGYANLGNPSDSGYGAPRYTFETRPINAYVNWIIKY